MSATTTSDGAGLVGRVRGALRDPLIRNSLLMLLTTLSMAAVGAIFWIITARVASRAEVGLASSLVATTEALAIFAQLGLGVSLLRILPRSDRKASDVVVTTTIVAGFAAVLALGYGALLPVLSPDLADLISWSWTMPVFALLVAGTALNQLTDGMFLGIDRVLTNLYVNGVMLSAIRLVLPFGLAGAGAFAIFGVVAGSALLAALVSLWAIFRALPDRPRMQPSTELRSSIRLSGAGYVTNVLYVTPQLVFPVLIINADGPSDSAVFFISFQIVTLLNHAVYMISNSMYAEVSRAPERVQEIVAKAGKTILVASLVGIGVLVLAAPLVLRVFGGGYADEGTMTLRVLALGTIGVGFNYWSSVRLRIAQHKQAMVAVQLFATVSVIALAVVTAPHGIVWVAAAWGLGQFAGGAVGYFISRVFAPLSDGADHLTDPVLESPEAVA